MHFKNSIAAIIVIFAIIFVAKTFFSGLVYVGYDDNLSLAERIKPLGQVYLSGEVQTSVIQAPKTASKTRSGEQVYTATCSACHSIGVLNAPKSGNKADWAPRIKRGLDSLLTSAISGVRAMPPKGTCMNCSNDELKAAIEYMIQ